MIRWGKGLYSHPVGGKMDYIAPNHKAAPMSIDKSASELNRYKLQDEVTENANVRKKGNSPNKLGTVVSLSLREIWRITWRTHK